jgi:hypothetical protein
MTKASGWLAAALALALAGCAGGSLYYSYSRFLVHLDQEDLDGLNASGQEGARLIIGLLELDAQWDLRTGPGGKKVVQIEAINLPRRTDIDGKVYEAPPSVFRGPWVVDNVYVLNWAEKRRAGK